MFLCISGGKEMEKNALLHHLTILSCTYWSLSLKGNASLCDLLIFLFVTVFTCFPWLYWINQRENMAVTAVEYNDIYMALI